MAKTRISNFRSGEVGNGIDCRKARRLQQKLVLGGLEFKQKLALVRHLHDCPNCFLVDLHRRKPHGEKTWNDDGEREIWLD